MRKNRMMRAASALSIAVLLSTSMISGTFAKYVTSAEANDYARVAKWGVQITPNGTLFAKEYATTDTTTYTGDNSVESIDEWKVVAPGTDGKLTEVVLTGTPEVATSVTYDATVELTNWTLENGTEYCPIIFTVEGTEYKMDADVTTVEALINKVETAIENCKQVYSPNTDLSSKSADYPSVSWKWEFHVDDATDVKDTELGNLTANGRASIIKVDIKTTVTQVD